jgi:hypothetical protein
MPRHWTPTVEVTVPSTNAVPEVADEQETLEGRVEDESGGVYACVVSSHVLTDRERR